MNGMCYLPDLSGLTKLMADHVGRAAYLVPLVDAQGKLLGNNGDILMHRVFQRILNDLDIRLTSAPNQADVLILPPNGAMLETYSFPELFGRRLQQLPDLPLVLFPSSALFPRHDPSSLFSGRRSKTQWILRERFSFDHLTRNWGAELKRNGVELSLDHDVVVSGHRFVPEIVGTPLSADTWVIGARNDIEALPAYMTGGLPIRRHAGLNTSLTRLALSLPYGPWLTTSARIARRHRQIAMGEALMDRAPEEIRRQFRSAGKVIYCDASAIQFATFEQYMAVIRRANTVITNRLHMGLPAAVLGKQVVLIEGSYHKARGVYQHSLRCLTNVFFVGASG